MEKKHFVKIVTSLVTVLFKMTLHLCIYFVFAKKPIILSLFKIDTLNCTMYILTILTYPLTCVIPLHNLISMNFFFTERSSFSFIIVKRQPKRNCWSKRKIKVIIVNTTNTLQSRKFRRNFYISNIVSILSNLYNSIKRT